MTVTCPSCGAQASDEDWNCPACRINLYWSSQHYEDLAGIRETQGLPVAAQTPAFLRQAHIGAMSERPDAHADSKVRQVARRAMRADSRVEP